MDRLVSGAHMWRALIGVTVNRDGADAELVAGANDPERDLAAVGDENFGKHLPSGEWRVTGGECE